MKLALRELVRRPRGFAVPLGILLLLAMMLLYPMSVLDGVYANSTGGLRSLPGELVVFNAEAHQSLQRSRVDQPTYDAVRKVVGVTKVSPFLTFPLGMRIDDTDESVGGIMLATDRLAGQDAPPVGTALVDESLRSKGVREGTVLTGGPFRKSFTVTGFVKDTNLVLQGGMFVHPDTFRDVLMQNTPDMPFGPGNALAFVVTVAPGASVEKVSAAIDAATGETTETVTIPTAIEALPGLELQAVTFSLIRMVTMFVALLVVALFLSFVTLERMPLYAVLKAVGASSMQLFTGVLAQVVAISFVAVSAAVALTFVLTVAVPFGNIMRPDRIVQTLVGLSATAALGACLSLRRVISVDPASAIG